MRCHLDLAQGQMVDFAVVDEDNRASFDNAFNRFAAVGEPTDAGIDPNQGSGQDHAPRDAVRRGGKSVCCGESLANGQAIGQSRANSLSFTAARGGCGAADGSARPRHGRLSSLRAKSTNVI